MLLHVCSMFLPKLWKIGHTNKRRRISCLVANEVKATICKFGEGRWQNSERSEQKITLRFNLGIGVSNPGGLTRVGHLPYSVPAPNFLLHLTNKFIKIVVWWIHYFDKIWLTETLRLRVWLYNNKYKCICFLQCDRCLIFKVKIHLFFLDIVAHEAHLLATWQVFSLQIWKWIINNL